MNNDPQGLAGAPETGKLMELMEWLASPDGGALNRGQAGHIARSISRGDVPNVKMSSHNRTIVDIVNELCWSVSEINSKPGIGSAEYREKIIHIPTVEMSNENFKTFVGHTGAYVIEQRVFLTTRKQFSFGDVNFFSVFDE